MLLNWRTFFLKNSAAYMIIVIRDLLGRLYLLGIPFLWQISTFYKDSSALN